MARMTEKERYQLRRDEQLAYHREYYKKNKKKLQERERRRYVRDRAKIIARCSAYQRSHKPQVNAKNRAYRVRIRSAVLELLGSHCARCGFKDIRALQVDHKNGDGSKERRALGIKGLSHGLMRKILTGGKASRKRYQILCANCNWIKRVERGEHRARR